MGRHEIWKRWSAVQAAIVWRCGERFFCCGAPLLRRRLCRTLTQAHASAILPQYGTPQGPSKASSTNKVEIECARQCPASCHVRSARGGQCRVGGLSTGIKPRELGRTGDKAALLRNTLGLAANQAWAARKYLKSHINIRLSTGHAHPSSRRAA